LDAKIAQEFRTAAKKSGRRFLPVYLKCSDEENQRRASTEERKRSQVNKLVDATILKKLKANNVLFYFHEEPHFTLDVTYLTPDEAAEQIYEYIMDIETRDYVVGESKEDTDVEED
jgi:hypothetical protein